jgi:DNA-binding winged helix-turn-helix (wHTH) protein
VQSNENTKTYSFFDYKLIPSENILLRGDELVSLRPKTFGLLSILVENAGKLCEKEKLIAELWDDVIIEEGNLNRTVSELRKILGDDSGEAKYIQTVTRVGYRFVAEVEVKNSQLETEEENSQVEKVEIPEVAEEKIVEKSKPTFFNWKTLGFTAISLLLFLGIGATIWKMQGLSKSKLTKFGEFQVTDNKNNEDSAFWTNDGKIRFTSHSKEKPSARMRINTDGSELTEEGNPISPDGKISIIYDEIQQISYISNFDGSDKRKLPIIVGNMGWSKVSNEIVVQFFPDGKRDGSEIGIINLETLELTNLTNSPNSFDGDPSFSPDAQQVLFTS